MYTIIRYSSITVIAHALVVILHGFSHSNVPVAVALKPLPGAMKVARCLLALRSKPLATEVLA